MNEKRPIAKTRGTELILHEGNERLTAFGPNSRAFLLAILSICAARTQDYAGSAKPFNKRTVRQMRRGEVAQIF
jgi:hypothetical protein